MAKKISGPVGLTHQASSVADCPHCGNSARCRRRDISSQTLSVLLAWGEVEPPTVDQPICDSCYEELRELMIERSEELAAAIADPSSIQRNVAGKSTGTRTVAKKVEAPAAQPVSKKPAKKSKVA